MKQKLSIPILVFLLLASAHLAKAQKVDSIYFNLYTDSLKKGSWNYINVDAKLSNGKYIPLNNQQISISTTAGKLEGNSIWLDWDFKPEFLSIEVKLKENPAVSKRINIWVKKHDLQLNAPVQDSLLKQINNKQKRQKKKN
jgi:hypothetical protein